MDIKLGGKYPSSALSNLATHHFVFDGVECHSMEGFLQGIKFKDVNMQIEICKLTGKGAKKAGAKKKWQKTQTLWWKGKPIKRESDEYQALLDGAYEALFTQNKKAAKALLATQNANLTHSLGRRKMSETVLTKQEFCSRLMNMRDRLKG